MGFAERLTLSAASRQATRQQHMSSVAPRATMNPQAVATWVEWQISMGHPFLNMLLMEWIPQIWGVKLNKNAQMWLGHSRKLQFLCLPSTDLGAVTLLCFYWMFVRAFFLQLRRHLANVSPRPVELLGIGKGSLFFLSFVLQTSEAFGGKSKCNNWGRLLHILSTARSHTSRTDSQLKKIMSFLTHAESQSASAFIVIAQDNEDNVWVPPNQCTGQV